jgi:membrane associated rhomboid family serine protease
VITRALIVLNVLAYIWEIYTGALQSDAALIRAGVLTPQLVLQDHQWWRIITSGFLHGGLAHIGLNMLSLYWLGRFIETVLGSSRMLLIYMVSLIVSGLTIVFFSAWNVPTLGASGAIFGLFGALFAIGIKLGNRGTELVRSNIGILVLNLIFSFTFPGISWQAHVGGLIAGFLTTYAVFYPPKPVYTPVYDTQSGAQYESQIEMPDDEQRY